MQHSPGGGVSVPWRIHRVMCSAEELAGKGKQRKQYECSESSLKESIGSAIVPVHRPTQRLQRKNAHLSCVHLSCVLRLNRTTAGD